MPPECLVATRPAGAAPRPASTHASRSALKRTRWMQDNGGSGRGDNIRPQRPGTGAKAVLSHTGERIKGSLTSLRSERDHGEAPIGAPGIAAAVMALERLVEAVE